MFLGRNTTQWTGFLTSFSGVMISAIPLLFPNGIGQYPVSSLTSLVGIFVAGLGLLIAFIANTSLTPVADPRLAIGQVVNAGLPNQGVVVAVEDKKEE